jgi:hypothetical protein
MFLRRMCVLSGAAERERGRGRAAAATRPGCRVVSWGRVWPGLRAHVSAFCHFIFIRLPLATPTSDVVRSEYEMSAGDGLGYPGSELGKFVYLLGELRASISLTPAPPLRPQSPRVGFWRRRLRKIWALTEKARRRVYCTGLRANWSELAYARPLSASETEPF